MKKRLPLCLIALILALSLPAHAETSFTGYQAKHTTPKQLTEGVTYTTYTLSPQEGPAGRAQRLFLVDIDPTKNPALAFTTAFEDGLIHGAKMRTTELAAQEKAQSGEKIVVGVNADFFDVSSGGSLGFDMREGRWVTAGEFSQGWAFGWTKEGKAVIGQPKTTLSLSAYRNGVSILENQQINALNALRADVSAAKSSPANALAARRDNALVLYTADFDKSTMAADGGVEVRVKTASSVRSGESLLGTVTQINDPNTDTKKGTSKTPQGMTLSAGSVVLSGIGLGAQALSQLQLGDTVEISCTADALFDGAVTVVGGGRPDGGPLLVKDGQKADIDVSAVDDYAIFYPHNPRTVVGIRQDGTLFLLVIEGNRSGSYGMTIEQTQQVALDLGAWTALNLDGGPSSTLAILSGKKVKLVTNTTGSGRETLVGNALLLTEKDH